MLAADRPIDPDAATADTEAEWAFLGRRVLAVSRFPPAEDGIGRYADQLLDALSPGREFFRLGIPSGHGPPGGGDQVVALWGLLHPLRMLRYARGYDDVLVMYQPPYFHHPLSIPRGAFRSRILSYSALLLVSRLKRMSVVIHEPDEPRPDALSARGRLAFRIEERVRRALWANVATLVFHSEWERRRFAERFPPGRRAERIVTHGSFFTSPLGVSRAEARLQLGLRAKGAVLLLIGFISPHKGYERAINAVREAAVDGVKLHIVGSPIVATAEVLDYVAQLRRDADTMPQLELHEQFVSDADFDLWIRAADAVIVPYHRASSSSVVARAHLIDTPLIASGAGGIGEQLADGDIRFSTDAELVEAIRRIGAQTPR